jgi:hypothetical protein
MLLELAEDLLAQGIRDLGVDAGVLNILMAQVIGHVFNVAAGLQEVHGHGVTECMDRSRLNAGRRDVIIEQLLHLALLQGTLAAGEEVRPDVSALPQIAAQQFGRVPPQGLFAAEPVFRSPDGDPVVLEVYVINGEHQRFADSQAIVVDQTKEGLVAGGIDRGKEALELILGEIFGKCAHTLVLMNLGL